MLDGFWAGANKEALRLTCVTARSNPAS